MWDNPNYWLRYALVRTALGLSSGREVGVLGPFRTVQCRQTLRRFGIADAVELLQLAGNWQIHRRAAFRLLARTHTPDDVLGWRLPAEFPADLVYDGILKRQRSAVLRLDDPQLPGYVAEALGSLHAAERLLRSRDIRLVVLSHCVHFHHASLAWQAVRLGIPTLVLYGGFGVNRFVRLTSPHDLYETTNRPVGVELSDWTSARAQALAQAGKRYLEHRWAGRTRDIGAVYAYHRRQETIDREPLCRQFGWDPQRTLIGVYAPNWFDFPHSFGMSNFRDFYDWLQTTVHVAARRSDVNWLFKAHPIDDRYGGVTLRDLMPFPRLPHIQLAHPDWNGSALMGSLDALVTYHGTAGIECAAMGKPVLVCDRGWYHDAGIAKWARSRQEYLAALMSEWWKELDLRDTTRRAQIFAGGFFCRPAWQDGFVLEDDAVQDPIYEKIPRLFAQHQVAIAKELETLRGWFHSDSKHYHTYKMSFADTFVV